MKQELAKFKAQFS